MKNLLAFLSLVALTATVSATTFSWSLPTQPTGTNVNTPDATQKWAVSKANASTTGLSQGSIALVANMAAGVQNAVVFTAGRSTTDGVTISIANGNYTATTFGITGGTTGTAETVAATGGKTVFGIVLDRGNNNAIDTLNVYVGDKVIYSLTGGNVNNQNWWQNYVVGGTFSDVGTDAPAFADTNFTIYAANSLASASDIAALPEPTVLALLALGVAGIALRRKAA